VQPRLTTAQAEKIKPKEVISTFSTQFPYNPPRTENITIAARTLNGTFVAPGQTFSLNGVLGQRTAAKGYNSAPVIVNGRLTKDFGGGISQLSTTLFNAIFFSGARIEEHHPHSFYISRYPEGREATISWPDVDNRFTNDTGYGILIQAFVSGNSVTVTFHGTKVWDIEAAKGPRRNVVQPKNIVDDRPTCVPQTPTPGFDVTVTRIFKKAGKVVKTSSFNTHYIPEDNVRCTHPSAG
jgi:vancomycin resistance protein YoaR